MSRLRFGTRVLRFGTLPLAFGALGSSAPASGSSSPVYTPQIATKNATRVDLVASKSAVAPNTPVAFSVIPNGLWAGQLLTLQTSGSGLLQTTLQAPSGGSDPLAFSYTPTAEGSHQIHIAGPGLYSPYAHPLTCFTASSGAPKALSASLLLADLAPHQYDVYGAKPTGFGGMDCIAWGEVPFTLEAGVPGLWVRLYDALSANASTAVGSGTALHSTPVQVCGPAAAGVVIPLLPGSRFIYFADLATDAAFTNPVRVSNRFSVGLVMATLQRSMECGIARAYGNSGTDYSTGQTFATTVTNVTFDPRYGSGNPWFRHDGFSPSVGMFGEASSSGTQRIGELVAHYLGLTLGITGISQAGGDIPDHINHDGSPASGFTETVKNVRNKFRWMWANNIGWNAIDPTYPDENVAEVSHRVLGNVDYTMSHYPACAIFGLAYGEQGWNLNNGSAKQAPQPGWPGGEIRFATFLRNQLGVHVINKGSAGVTNGNNGGANHPDMAARATYAETGFRALYAGELAAFGGLQTTALGPKLSATGTTVRGSGIIRVPFTHNGTKLLGYAVSYDRNDPSRVFQTATSGELASLFAVYTGPGGVNNSSASILQVAGVTIDNDNHQFVITMAGGQTLPNFMTLQYNCDWGLSNQTLMPNQSFRASFITDDRLDPAIGIQFGWHAQPAFDIEITTI